MTSPVPLRRIEGRFYRAIRADRIDAVLDPPGPGSAGRYHRHGEPALYVTHEADWAAIAVGGYMAEDGQPRMIVPLDIGEAWVVDQHDDAACSVLGFDRERSNVRWRGELAECREPPSWQASDAARSVGADGIVDRSRGITGGWHVALFRWNELGGPAISVASAPFAVDYPAARLRWASPPDWVMPRFDRAEPTPF